MEIDPRVIKLTLQIDGELKTYDGLNIVASGTKYANANQNEAEIQISNLDKSTRDYILTQTSPFNLDRTPKIAILEAGRKSYGTVKIFEGNIINASPSQPPDITITLKCMTGNFSKGNVISRNTAGISTLSSIASQVASDLNLALNFQAIDKQIANYNFIGGALKQVDKLAEMGSVNAYVDDLELIVKDLNKALSNQIKLLNLDSGMIGIPEITEKGIKVKFLLDNQTKLGGALQIQSVINPSVNGTYTIYKLGFEIANRDVQFYWIAEATR